MKLSYYTDLIEEMIEIKIMLREGSLPFEVRKRAFERLEDLKRILNSFHGNWCIQEEEE